MKPNRPPSEPYQFFGSGRIDARTGALTMKLHNVNGEIYSVELPPPASHERLQHEQTTSNAELAEARRTEFGGRPATQADGFGRHRPTCRLDRRRCAAPPNR